MITISNTRGNGAARAEVWLSLTVSFSSDSREKSHFAAVHGRRAHRVCCVFVAVS
jgi:hypothetical protein